MPSRLTEKQKIDILLLHAQGHHYRAIASQSHCSLGEVSRIIHKYQESGSVANRRPSFPSFLSDPRNRRLFRTLIRKHRLWTSKHIAAQMKERYGVIISPRTLRRSRLSLGFKTVLFRRKSILNTANRLKRLKYCYDNEGEEWDDVWFSDEKLFRIDFKGQRVWKQPWEEEIEAFEPPRQVSVLVWGAVSWNGRTSLHTTTQPFDADAYTNIIWKHLIEQQPESFDRLLQDNASPHKANHTLSFLTNFEVELVRNYPPYSPELNPIEHVWGWMVKRINENFPHSLDELKEQVKEAWTAIPQTTIQNYIAHLPTVCSQIIQAQGGSI